MGGSDGQNRYYDGYNQTGTIIHEEILTARGDQEYKTFGRKPYLKSVIFAESVFEPKDQNPFLKRCLLIFEKETEREHGRGRERGRHNLKQALGSELSAQSWMRASNSQTTRSCPEPKSDA